MPLEDPAHVGTFLSVGSVKTFYRSRGDGEPILLLHGFPSSSYDWRRFLQPLSKYGRVIAPDLYGFGYSEAPSKASYTLDGYEIFLRDFLSAMGIDRFTLVGHDWGGVIALRYAIENPDSVSKLVIMDASLYPDWVEHQRTSPDYSIIRRMEKNSLVKTMAQNLISKKTVKRAIAPRTDKLVTDEDLEHYKFFFKRGINAIRLYSKDHLRWIEENAPRLNARLNELRIPTMIIWGREDPYFPAKTPERLHSEIPGSTLHVLESVGHWPSEERPEQIIELISSFLQAKDA